MENADCWIKPSLQPFIATPRLIELVYLALKYSENSRGRITMLELGGEWMSGEILFSLSFVFLEGFFEDYFEI